MGSGDIWVLQPNHYPLNKTWHNAIAPIRRFRLQPTGFPLRNWNPDFLSLLTIAEFAATDWRNALDPGQPPGPDDTNREVDHLIELARLQRPERLDEILAQYSGHHTYYLGLLILLRQ
jgi:hypothetical protein